MTKSNLTCFWKHGPDKDIFLNLTHDFEKCLGLYCVESMEVEGRNCIKPETEFFPFLFFFQKF